MNYYPIVFIRGYAAAKGDVESAVSDPHRGFNVGSSILKLTNNEDSNDQSALKQFDFPGPLLRLLQEYGYRDALTNRFVSPQNEPFPDAVSKDQAWRKTVWIFDIYRDEYFGEERPLTEGYAKKLAVFLDRIRQAAGKPLDFKVNLVAHSMGGLVCRCYLQNTQLFQDPALNGVLPVLVNKLVTYGTPHKGIDFRRGLELAEWIKNTFGPLGSNAFGEPRMRDFLSLPQDAALHSLAAARNDISAERTFSIIGTNYKVYDVLFGLSSKAVGPRSDGLVMIDNAYVCNGPRAYIDCSHSGYMGLLNSEAGYQNLIRFLFGNIRYKVILKPLTVDNSQLRQATEELDHLTIQSKLTIQGLASYISNLTTRDGSALSITMKSADNGNGQSIQADPGDTTLFVNFIDTNYHPDGQTYVEGAVDIRIEPHYKSPNGILGFLRPNRLEGEFIFNDRLQIRLHFGTNQLEYYWGAKPAWVSAAPHPDGHLDGSLYAIPFPSYVQGLLQGDGVCIATSQWT